MDADPVQPLLFFFVIMLLLWFFILRGLRARPAAAG